MRQFSLSLSYYCGSLIVFLMVWMTAISILHVHSPHTCIVHVRGVYRTLHIKIGGSLDDRGVETAQLNASFSCWPTCSIPDDDNDILKSISSFIPFPFIFGLPNSFTQSFYHFINICLIVLELN